MDERVFTKSHENFPAGKRLWLRSAEEWTKWFPGYEKFTQPAGDHSHAEALRTVLAHLDAHEDGEKDSLDRARFEVHRALYNERRSFEEWRSPKRKRGAS